MSRNLPSIDRRIIELLLKSENATFCVQGLRDQYLELYDVNPTHKALLRRFIYERIKKLVKAHFVVMDSERRKRGQQYHVSNLLLETDLSTDEDGFGEWLQRIQPQASNKLANNQGKAPSAEESKPDQRLSIDSQTTLEKKLSEAQSQFLESLGEVETFQQLIHDHPELKHTLSADCRKAHEHSSRLLGRVSALEKALRHVSAP
ncbi:hypothetical protein HME01_32170 [Vreelandella aquamarina]|uniref:Transcriptional regulator VspR n=1 Tax=Vreelandella aquamarina TaxID=77097 RepID=A0A1N6EN07_9GAMM|nr:hypothetical protein [Halomonas meridiana]GED47365.1 hypothetical protein HME01_32170 [Halomonas meridiana]SIN84350.1 hypothetical protein SAMN05878249_3741 [Halomonas meridiana]SIN88245.1 hypothetical protein SAMN05878438_3806 [Halomonas meridiana]SIO51119.1 hypothetical protein SAMN05878442_3770 [Halomonas meridiana]